MKKRFLLIVPIVILCMMFFAKQTDAGYPTLNLTSDAKTISAGQKTQLKVGGVKSNKIKWTSSNKNVATVSKKGVVTGVSAGKATIKGKYRGIEFKVKFTVESKTKVYNKLLCKDDNFSVYLKEIKDGFIYIEVKNTSDVDCIFYNDYFVIDGKTYYDMLVYEKIYAGISDTIKVYSYDKNYDIYNYNFTKGKIKAQFEYYENSSKPDRIEGKLKFETEIK